MPSKRPSQLGPAGVHYDADSRFFHQEQLSVTFFMLLLSILKCRPVLICAARTAAATLISLAAGIVYNW